MFDILTGAPIDINELLAQPYLPNTAGWDGNMAVGAVTDPDLAVLQDLIATSGDFNIATGGFDILTTGFNPYENMVVGAPARPPMNAAQQRQLQQLQAQMKAMANQNNALKQQLMQSNQRLAQQVAQNKSAQAQNLGTKAALVERDPDKYSFMPLPVNSNGNIAAFGSQVVQAEPQYHFKPKILKVPDGSFWLIGDVKVGARSQFAGAGNVPGQVFSELATDVHLIGDTATPGQKVYVNVQNLTGVARPFNAVILGHVVS